MINPHGGKLINCIVNTSLAKVLTETTMNCPTITLTNRQITDLEMLGIGAYSPLTGFMGKQDYLSVVNDMRLVNGIIWPLPITLAVDKSVTDTLSIGNKVRLTDGTGKLLAILNLTEIYEYNKEKEAEKVYRTCDTKHPGVNVLYEQGDVLCGGEVQLVHQIDHHDFIQYHLTPVQTRNLFKEKGWRTVVGFQTRNPVHRAHEYIQKCALEILDGLFLHPIVGETKGDDISASVRMKCYEMLLEKYYPSNRVVLAINPASMRYAGPREAVFHSIIRKNYGCTHFIVGRDHAGVGNYYGTYDAQKIFAEFKPEELEIEPLFFEHTFYCRKCNNMASSKTCPHSAEDWIMLSGTKVRAMLQEEQIPPLEFTRPEIAKILIDSMKKKPPSFNI